MHLLCLSSCETLGPVLPWCSVIVAAAVAFLAEVDDHRVLRAGRDQPRTELIGTAELNVPAVEIAKSAHIAYLERGVQKAKGTLTG